MMRSFPIMAWSSPFLEDGARPSFHPSPRIAVRDGGVLRAVEEVVQGEEQFPSALAGSINHSRKIQIPDEGGAGSNSEGVVPLDIMPRKEPFERAVRVA